MNVDKNIHKNIPIGINTNVVANANRLIMISYRFIMIISHKILPHT